MQRTIDMRTSKVCRLHFALTQHFLGLLLGIEVPDMAPSDINVCFLFFEGCAGRVEAGGCPGDKQDMCN